MACAGVRAIFFDVNTDTITTYPIPMNRSVILGFFLAVAVVAGVIGWSFASGLAWTGICMIVVAAPLALLFWFMLYVNPSRAVILADEDGLTVSVPPFMETKIGYSDIVEFSKINLKTDNPLAPEKPKRGIRWGAYRAGTFLLADGDEALVATNTRHVLRLRTPEALFLLGPDGVDALESRIAAKTS